ncbi:hypothetical protein [Kocuria nitroreducens]|uniref:hypothetical protein n=1 Tax=Kocuria nitroreducens TaxID=3058914 RepID=UPI0036DEC0D7
MTEISAHIPDGDIYDLQSVHPGDRVEVWDRGVLRYRGRVEELVPHLGVVWIRETWTWERKMITVDDYCVRSYSGPYRPSMTPHTPPSTGPAAMDSTCLGPSDLFPTDLAELSLVELQVLHSRISRQLDSEYLTDPAGPHPVTTDRHHEVVLALDAHTST